MSQDAAPTLPPFFADFAMARGKLVLARLLIFGVLAVDAALQLRHAPRYGAGFNVAHVPGLDALAPGRVGFAVAQVVLALALGAIALGVGSRLLVGAAAAIYAWVYLSSQLDSYQHHYLVMLFLLVSTAVPWFAPATAPSGPPAPVRSWALRLILLQLAIMYAWAALAKLEGPWLDGSTLARQIGPGLARDGLEWIGVARGAKLIILVELVLAATIAVPRLWPVALPVGLGLHVGIILSKLEIGVFAWLMLAMYLLVVPERWIAPGLALARRVGARAAIGAGTAPALGWFGLVGAVAAVVVVALVIEVPGALAGAILGAALVVATDLGRARPRRPRLLTGAAPLLAAALAAYLARSHGVVSDYYRFWGGSARRLGDRASALHAYQRLTEVDPANPGGHYQRGRLLGQAGAGADPVAAETALRRAAALEPTKARALVELARQLARAGRVAEAQAALAEARQREPGHAELGAVERALAGAGAAVGPGGGGADADGAP